MNTRGKKIEFAEMLTPSLKSAEKPKLGRPPKTRTISPASSKQLTSSLPSRRAGRACNSEDKVQTNRKQDGQCQQTETPKRAFGVKNSAAKREESLSCVNEVENKTGSVPLRQSGRRTKTSCLARSESIDSCEMESGSSRESVKAQQAENSMRSSRRSQPLDYKCLAGLKKRKSMEIETPTSRSAEKSKADGSGKPPTKRMRLEDAKTQVVEEKPQCAVEDDRCGSSQKLEETENKIPENEMENVLPEEKIKTEIDDTKIEDMCAVKLEEADSCEDSSKMETDECPVADTSPCSSKQIPNEAESLNATDLPPAESDHVEKHLNSLPTDGAKSLDSETVVSDSLPGIQENHSLTSKMLDSAITAESVTAESVTTESVTAESKDKVDEVPVNDGPSRGPYDNDHMSQLIRIVEERMRKCKREAKDFSENCVDLPPLPNFTQKDKLSASNLGRNTQHCATSAKAENDSSEEDDEERFGSFRDWESEEESRSTSGDEYVKLENSLKKSPSGVVAVKGRAGDEKMGLPLLDLSKKGSQTTDHDNMTDIGKGRMNARKSFEMSLARAMTAASTKQISDDKGKSNTVTSFGAWNSDSKSGKEKKGWEVAKSEYPARLSSSSSSSFASGEALSYSSGSSLKMPCTGLKLESHKSNEFLTTGLLTTPLKVNSRCEADEPEIDQIDGFTFMAFTSQRALEEHMKKLNVEKTVGGSSSAFRFDKGLHAAVYSESKGSRPLRGNESMSPEMMAACFQKRDALLKHNDVKPFSLETLKDLGLKINVESGSMVNVESCSDEGISTAKITRRGIGKMGNEKRQPRKGKIYGRKVTGRFASKANIKYYVKKRSPDSLVQPFQKPPRLERCVSESLPPGNGPKRGLPWRKGIPYSGRCSYTPKPVIITMQMAIEATQALYLESDVKVQCDQKDCAHSGTDGHQPQYEPLNLSQNALPTTKQALNCSSCEKEHCRLGCVCDSLRTPQKKVVRTREHCGRPECMFECNCQYLTRSRALNLSAFSTNDDSKEAITTVNSLTEHAVEDGLATDTPPTSYAKLPTKRKRRGWGISLPMAGDRNSVEETCDSGQLLRKSGRIRDRTHFGDIAKLKSLIFYDASLWLRDDQGRTKKRKIEKSSHGEDISTPKVAATRETRKPVRSVIDRSKENFSNLPSMSIKLEPISCNISDDEKPDTGMMAKEEFEPEPEKTERFAARLSRVASGHKTMTTSHLTEMVSSQTKEPKADFACEIISPDANEGLKLDSDDAADDEFTSCARTSIYTPHGRLRLDESQNFGQKFAAEASLFAAKSASTMTETLKLVPQDLRTNVIPREEAKSSSKNRPYKEVFPLSSGMSPESMKNSDSSNFNKHWLLVKKNINNKDRTGRVGNLEGPSSVLLDVFYNCHWQENRDQIVSKVYEFVAEGQLTEKRSFEYKNLIIELLPKSDKEVAVLNQATIPRHIREAMNSSDLHFITVKIIKKPEGTCGASAIVAQRLPPAFVTPSQMSLSGLKNFVSGGSLHAATLLKDAAHSCKFGPFTAASHEAGASSNSSTSANSTVGSSSTGATSIPASKPPGKSEIAKQGDADSLMAGNVLANPVACRGLEKEIESDGELSESCSLVATSSASITDASALKESHTVHWMTDTVALPSESMGKDPSLLSELTGKDLSLAEDVPSEEMLQKPVEAPSLSTDPDASDKAFESGDIRTDTVVTEMQPTSADSAACDTVLKKQPTENSDVGEVNSIDPLSSLESGREELVPVHDSIDLEQKLTSSLSSSNTSLSSTIPIVITAEKRDVLSSPSASNAGKSDDQLVISSTFHMNSKTFDSLPSTSSPLPVSVPSGPVLIASVSGPTLPVSVALPSKVLPASSVHSLRIVAVPNAIGGKPLVPCNLTTSASGKPIFRVSTPALIPGMCNVRSSLPRVSMASTSKPPAIIVGQPLALPLQMSVSQTMARPGASFCVIRPKTVIPSLGVTGISLPSGPSPKNITPVGSGCLLVPTSKLLRLSVPISKSDESSGQKIRPQFSKASGSFTIQDTLTLGKSILSSGFIQMKPLNTSAIGFESTAVTDAVLANRPRISLSSATKVSSASIGRVARLVAVRPRAGGISKDVIEIDDSEEERCVDEEVDILCAEGNGSNEAMLLRQKLGIPLHIDGPRVETVAEQQASQPPRLKKKRKQMHEEKVELPVNMEFTEGWVMVPKEDAKVDPVPTPVVKEKEASTSEEPAAKQPWGRINNSSQLKRYSALFKAFMPHLKRAELRKRKLSQLYIIEKAVEVIKSLDAQNKILISEFLSETVTSDNLSKRLKSLQAPSSTVDVDIGSGETSLVSKASGAASSGTSTSDNQPLTERRRVPGVVKRKFRGISKKELDCMTAGSTSVEAGSTSAPSSSAGCQQEAQNCLSNNIFVELVITKEFDTCKETTSIPTEQISDNFSGLCSSVQASETHNSHKNTTVDMDVDDLIQSIDDGIDADLADVISANEYH